MTEPDRSPPGDELTERYREASAQDARGPGAHVRDAVRAHAQMVIAAEKARGTAANTVQTQAPAANQSRWKISALASLALVGLTGLLVLQFDRGSDEEKDLVFGQPSASAPPAAAPAPAPAAAPANTAPQPEAKTAAGATENPATPALKAPATPAAKKPAPQAAAREQSSAKAEAESPQAFGGAMAPGVPPPPAAPPAPPSPAVAQDSARLSRSAPMADAVTGTQAAAPAQRADAPAPAFAPAIPAPAARAVAPAMAPPAPAAMEQRQEKSAAPASSLRTEATGSLGLAGALQQSARTGNLQQLERLLQQGAPVNAADSAGRTPLVLAVMQGHTAVVQRLLAAGANTALVDKDGLNALQHARRLGLDGIAHLIERAP